MDIPLADITLTAEQIGIILAGVGVLAAGVGKLLTSIQTAYSRRAEDSDKEIERVKKERDADTDRLTKQNAAQQVMIDQLKKDGEEMWTFNMDRGRVQAVVDRKKRTETLMPHTCDVTAGNTTPAPDMGLMPAGTLAALNTKRTELQDLYRSKLAGLKDDVACLEIQSAVFADGTKYSDWLRDAVCVPNDHSHGECLIYALLVAKGEA